MYQIFETNIFLRDLKKISPFETRIIKSKLDKIIYDELRSEPHYGPNIKKLIQYQPNTYRYRIGRFRLFYSVDEVEKVVVISAIRHRKDAYR